jgi:hypothetical protein
MTVLTEQGVYFYLAVTFFPEYEFPQDISTLPAEIGGLDYESMGFGPDGPDGFDGWAA